MSIQTAANDLAHELARQESVEILCHHDADGIAAGSIMAMALYRSGIPFRLRITHRLSEENLPKHRPLLLCDLGAGLAGLPEDTMVIDHHLPLFEGPYHVNPRHEGLDGDTELCAAGTAFLVANALGDNRDLAGLPLLGIIGDGQQMIGKNQEIYREALANGIIRKKRGVILPGREPVEQVELATEPFLHGISGSKEQATKIVQASTEDELFQQDTFNSLIVLHAAEVCKADVLDAAWGDVWLLDREVIEHAYTMAWVVDSCGKAGAGSAAVSLCLRSSKCTEKAFALARAHRIALIEEMNRFLTEKSKQNSRPIMCTNQHLISDLADLVVRNIPNSSPVIVAVQKSDGTCACSVRTDGNHDPMVGAIVSECARACAGTGGGHRTRAGAIIPAECLEQFTASVIEGLHA